MYSIQSLAKTDTLGNGTKFPSQRDASEINEERHGPTMGAQISE